MINKILISERRLKEIISESVSKVLGRKALLTEMPVERGIYVNKCLDTFQPVATHISKMCMYSNILPNNMNGWADTVAEQIYFNLLDISVVNDNKRNRKRNKTFVDAFVYGRIHTNFDNIVDVFEPYCRKAIHDVTEGGCQESFSKQQILNTLNAKQSAIISFFSKLGSTVLSFTNNPEIPIQETIKTLAKELMNNLK